MKRKIIYIICLCIAVNLFSCSSPKDVHLVFDQHIDLTFESLEADDLFFKPLCIEAFDSLLLVCDPTEQGLYALYNLNTNKIVCKGGIKGSGPNDLIATCIIDKINNDCFQVVDVSNRKILFFNVTNIMKTKDFVPYDNIPFNLVGDAGKAMQVLYQADDSVYVGLGTTDEGKYLVYNRDTCKYWGTYPEKEKVQIDPYWVHQGVCHIDRERKLILYHSPFGLYYELLSLDGDKLIPLFTEFFSHSYREAGNECIITDETSCGINHAEITKDGVFLLFSGRTMKDSPKMFFYCRKILFVGLNGEHKIEYQLDRDIAMMAIDESRRKIYVISVNPETFELELGFYKY